MKVRLGSIGLRRITSLGICATLLCATGCKGFFPPLTDTGGTTPVNTGNYAYVASSYTASATPIYTISGFSIGTGTLTALSGFPLTLPFAPATMAVNPANTLLYVAGAGVLYGYSIAASGALTTILSSTNSAALVNANIVSMDISPDGQWLVAIDANTSIPTVDLFQIGSTGQLEVEDPVTYPLLGSATVAPTSIRVDPTGTYVAASLGTGGDVLFGFTTSTGALNPLIQVNTLSTQSADQALAFDSTASTLYIVRSGTGGGVYPYAISGGGTSLTLATNAPFTTGAGPFSVVIDATGDYLYVGNRTDSTISGFSIGTGGVLTAISGSPFASGSAVNALGIDNSGKYLLATAGGGSPDLKMYSYDATTPGKLDAAATASTGDPTEPAGALAIALTHSD